MKSIQEISGWKTSDGQVFVRKSDAKRHEAKLSLRQLIQKEGGYTDAQHEIEIFLEQNGGTVMTLLTYIWQTDVGEEPAK